jgi:FlaA1/EpsC-like NDP-sugar epimerase
MKIHLGDVFIGVGVSAAFQLALGAVFIYRHRWRIGSFEEMVNVSTVVFSVGAILVVVSSLWLRSGLSYGDAIGAAIFTLVLTASGRGLYRFVTVAKGIRPRQPSDSRAIIFGAGQAGVQIIEALSVPNPSSLDLVALLDDDPAKLHLRIRSLSVAGSRKDIVKTANKFNATILLIAIANVKATTITELAELAKEANMEVRVLPSLSEMLSETAHVADIRPLTIEDLLGRREVETNFEIVSNLLRDKRVLVTGAGGSIGSELCRQISRFSPASLIMLDRNESGIFETQLSITGRALLDTNDLVLCDIRDRTAVDQVFEEYCPEVVFHAAALKHLSLLEWWPSEAVKTNVWGTANVLEASHRNGVRTFVNISTDKAANPISVLGHSKRIAERLTASYEVGAFISVRFGNVLGSQGSFLRVFREQVARGGPITVTDPDVTRYFMTISEAVQLTLQAAALGEGGEVLVLDMGEQVRITEVAERIAADSPTPIEIVFTGLRPGEKLKEELFGEGEIAVRSNHPSISSCSVVPILAEICWSLEANDSSENVKRALCKLAEVDATPQRLESKVV